MWTLTRAGRRHRRALRLRRAGHPLRALDLCRRAVTGPAGAELAAAMLTAGDLEFTLGRYAGAESAFRAAGPAALLPLGNTLRVLGRLREVEETLLHAAALSAAGRRCGTRSGCSARTRCGVIMGKGSGSYRDGNNGDTCRAHRGRC